MTLILNQYVKRGYLPVGMLLYWYDGTLNMDDEPISFTPRAVQNWLRKYRQAEATYGYGYLGLFDKSAQRGNRGSRIETASKELLAAFLKNQYAVPQAKRASAVLLYLPKFIQNLSKITQKYKYPKI